MNDLYSAYKLKNVLPKVKIKCSKCKYVVLYSECYSLFKLRAYPIHMQFSNLMKSHKL